MPSYEIEQYELHSQNYLVEAKNEAEAIKLVLAGEATPYDGAVEYIKVCKERGLVVDQHKELASLEMEFEYSYIPSIRRCCVAKVLMQ